MGDSEINCSNQAGAKLRARLFGAFALLTADGEEIPISNRRARALLAMLCLAPDETIDRDHLSKLLWPGRFQAQARASLRQCLSDLGKVLDGHGGNVLNIDRSRISLNRSVLQTDFSELESMLAAGAYDDASGRLTAIGVKSLLDQMNFGEAFDEWLFAHRREAEARLRAAIADALKTLAERDDDEDHDRLLAAWKVRDPNAGAGASGGLDDNIRVAVLPFRTLHAEVDQDYLADGVVDELITMLGRVPGIRVAGRTSSFHFKGADITGPKAAEALRVSHLVEGSVSQSGDDIRINVNLTDGRAGFELWGETYSGNADDIFAFREKVARSVVHGLSTALKLPAHEPRIGAMTGNREAYNLYLQGRALTKRAIGDGVLPTAVKLLEQALEIDPDFAECWTALAEAHVYTAVYTPCLDRVDESKRMAACAQKAIALDPAQGHARAMLAIHEWTLQNPVGALDLAYQAYRLEPDNPDVAIRLGSFLLYIGRTEEALPYIEAALAQDPVHGRNYAMLSVAHLNLGNFDKAIAAGQRMVDLGMPGMWLAVATAIAGDCEQAVEQYRRCRLLMNTIIFPPPGTEPMADDAMDAYWTIAAKGVCSGKPEDRALYCQMLGGLHGSMHDPYDPSIAFPAIWMGHSELVMKIYGEQIHPANMFGLMSLWADVDPIRRTRLHPEFLEFAERIGLVAAWEKYGWPDLLAPGSSPDNSNRQ